MRTNKGDSDHLRSGDRSRVLARLGFGVFPEHICHRPVPFRVVRDVASARCHVRGSVLIRMRGRLHQFVVGNDHRTRLLRRREPGRII